MPKAFWFEKLSYGLLPLASNNTNSSRRPMHKAFWFEKLSYGPLPLASGQAVHLHFRIDSQRFAICVPVGRPSDPESVAVALEQAASDLRAEVARA